MAPIAPPRNKEIDLVGAAVARCVIPPGRPRVRPRMIAQEYRVPEHLPIPHIVERVGAIRLHPACLRAGPEVIG